MRSNSYRECEDCKEFLQPGDEIYRSSQGREVCKECYDEDFVRED